MAEEKKTEVETEHGPKPTITDLAGIRPMVERHHGGHEATDDNGIMLIWDGLPDETQRAYKEAMKSPPKPVT